MVTIKKERDYSPMPGVGNGTFYGYAYSNNKRVGVVWKLKDHSIYSTESWYVCNEDFDRNIHSRENRPRQFKGKTLAELKANMNANL